jgi:hypothetical protein
MGKQNSSPSMVAVVNARSMVSMAGMMDKTGGFDVKKNLVPSFKI